MGGAFGYVAVGLLGALVGGTELAYRYRDNPARSLARLASAFYVIVNAAGSVTALFVIRAFGWTFGASSASSRDLLRVGLAGFGSLALFRTKLFSAAYQGENFAWGPSRLLEQLLAISDRQVDRFQAGQRSKDVAEIMAGVSFSKACTSLPTYALGLLESTNEEEQRRLGNDVKALIEDATMDDRTKAQQLGVALIRLTGPELLRQAVTALGESIRRDEESV